jgi:hypothetical protein
MLPAELKPEQFNGYPPQARKLVVAHLDALRLLPLSFLPGLLREAIDYDYKFPAEREVIEGELARLSALSSAEIKDRFQAFAHISLSSKLERTDWVGQPAQFTEQLSAHLWATHQLDAYRQAAIVYGDRMQQGTQPAPLTVNRLGIAIIGQGAPASKRALFGKLREHGTYFTHVTPDNGVAMLLDAVAARAKAHPLPYAHWYVDGGRPEEHSTLLTAVSYQQLEPVRTAILHKIHQETGRAGMGPEQLRTDMAAWTPVDLGMDPAVDPVLARFQIKLLTEGSGTQIFSTTFAQWTAREALRRAQPLTLLVRFAPRQRQRPMSELLSNTGGTVELDPAGSLIDADMGAWYHWLNQQRLNGSDRSSFLAWYEGQSQAVVVSPSLPRGTTSTSALDMHGLLSLLS